jgi:hypothetical protein
MVGAIALGHWNTICTPFERKTNERTRPTQTVG